MTSDATRDPVRVVYFAGTGRSGTTVINNILGQLEGAFAGGELRYLWLRGIVENRLCGCGAPFDQCPLWSAVMAPVHAAHPDLEAGDVAARLRARLAVRHVPRMLVRRIMGRPVVSPTPDDDVIVDLYRSLSDFLDGASIVDSSKLPPYGLLLDGRRELDVRILHIVRDPRATAFSWQRSKLTHDLGNDELMPKLQLWKSSVLWALWNALTVALWGRSDHYLRVRYEDFVANPEAVMRTIARHCGLPGAGLPFASPTTVTLAPTHSVAGNPSRHSKGEVRIRPDDEWTRTMSTRARWAVTAITAPALAFFGYAGRQRHHAGSAQSRPPSPAARPASTDTTTPKNTE